jgi:SAM-dependent methyltransferase
MASSSAVNDDHAQSWSQREQAASYERGRPGYPSMAAEVLTDELGLRPSTVVLDVAAGTGKLTRVLRGTPAAVVAVEPMAAMRNQLLATVPGATVVGGVAQALPFGDGAVHAITVAQAFHWFPVVEASHEFRRVLRRGGRLAVINNQRHASAPWVEHLWETLGRYERFSPRPETTRGWREALDRTGDFGAFDRFQVANEQRFASLEDFDARFTSISFVIRLQPDERRALLDELHGVVEDVHPLVMPLRTVIDVATRRG